jgi:hypothetical protein
MGLLSKIFGQRNFDKQLEGAWISDSEDKTTKNSIGDVTMTFTKDGKLFYDVHEGDKVQKINMVYRTHRDTLYSDQPSNPRQAGTKYKIENNVNLTLNYEGAITKFKRA